MIGLDTNVLVRLLVADDPRQHAQARAFVERHCSRESPAFVNSVVLAELFWVLANPYRYSRSQIARALENLLAGNDRVFEHHEEVRAALNAYSSGRADFIDALIDGINRAQGCETTATLDRQAAKLDGFTRLA
jgi:predicted nucleic-acid-binding protein